MLRRREALCRHLLSIVRRIVACTVLTEQTIPLNASALTFPILVQIAS